MDDDAVAAQAPEDDWVFALPLDELWEGEIVGLKIGSSDVLLVNLGHGVIRAFDNRCPHAGSRLSEGCLRGETLRCGTHHWEFDARTGDGINPKTATLTSYLVTVREGAVLVQLRAAGTTELPPADLRRTSGRD
ncbi:MAG TPA: Rieske (2Fe-2S) protein [Polyangiaceae bacterium]|nr:Rieske (2Fe-2S) protein [Polyangiaceae bacterium]